MSSGLNAQPATGGLNSQTPTERGIVVKEETFSGELDVKPNVDVWSTSAGTPARDPSGAASSGPSPGHPHKQLELDIKPNVDVWSTSAGTPARDPSGAAPSAPPR